ncbi:MAG: hypothetical protein EBR30_28840 [Cytophagia bacterium]|nr:hypothetical protein [Cytophagia bacterium]
MILQNTSGSQGMAVTENHVLFLIGEELKSRKFFSTLQDLGLDDSWYQPHLDEAILTCLDLNDNTNEIFDYYYAIMNEHAALIDKSPASIEEQARVVYVKLVLRK